MRPNWFIAWPVRAPSLAARVGEPPSGVRRLDEEDLHATIAFLGPVDEARARATFDRLPLDALRAVPIELGRVGLMGHPRRGTALAAHVDRGAGELAAVIERHRAALLAHAEARPDDRAPIPHVTLARIERRASPEQRRAALAWAAGLDLSGVVATLDRVALYTWSDRRPAIQFRVVVERRLST